MLDIGLRIKELRKRNNLSQVEFCDLIGVKQANLSHIENSGKKISVEILHKIISYFNIDGTWLLTGNGEMLIQDKKNESPVGKCENCAALEREISYLRKELDLKDELLEIYRPKNGKKAC